jgi:hypothetical protein
MTATPASRKPWVVLVNGPRRSGKTSFGKWAERHWTKYRVSHYAFAMPLKEMTHRFFGLSLRDYPWYHWNEREDKTKPSDLFWGLSPVEAYIWISEQVIKPKFGADYFGREFLRYVRWLETNGFDTEPSLLPLPDIFVIADCGFQIEADVLAQYYPRDRTILVRLTRQGTDWSGDSRGWVMPRTGQHFLSFENNHPSVDAFANALVKNVERILHDGQ